MKKLAMAICAALALVGVAAIALGTYVYVHVYRNGAELAVAKLDGYGGLEGYQCRHLQVSLSRGGQFSLVEGETGYSKGGVATVMYPTRSIELGRWGYDFFSGTLQASYDQTFKAPMNCDPEVLGR